MADSACLSGFGESCHSPCHRHAVGGRFSGPNEGASSYAGRPSGRNATRPLPGRPRTRPRHLPPARPARLPRRSRDRTPMWLAGMAVGVQLMSHLGQPLLRSACPVLPGEEDCNRHGERRNAWPERSDQDKDATKPRERPYGNPKVPPATPHRGLFRSEPIRGHHCRKFYSPNSDPLGRWRFCCGTQATPTSRS